MPEPTHPYGEAYARTELGRASIRAERATGGRIKHLYTSRPGDGQTRVVCNDYPGVFPSERAAAAWLNEQATEAELANRRQTLGPAAEVNE